MGGPRTKTGAELELQIISHSGEDRSMNCAYSHTYGGLQWTLCLSMADGGTVNTDMLGPALIALGEDIMREYRERACEELANGTPKGQA